MVLPKGPLSQYTAGLDWTGLQKVGLSTFQDFLRTGRKMQGKSFSPMRNISNPLKDCLSHRFFKSLEFSPTNVKFP